MIARPNPAYKAGLAGRAPGHGRISFKTAERIESHITLIFLQYYAYWAGFRIDSVSSVRLLAFPCLECILSIKE